MNLEWSLDLKNKIKTSPPPNTQTTTKDIFSDNQGNLNMLILLKIYLEQQLATYSEMAQAPKKVYIQSTCRKLFENGQSG